MGLYRYIAAPPGGASREILIEADTPKEALDKLRSRRFTPIRALGEAEEGRHGLALHRNKADVFEFTRQLSPLLDSFIPLEKALAIIAEGAAEPDQRNFVNSLRQGLHEGKKFSELVRGHGKLFPGYYANLIESGEETGCLPEVVRELLKFMSESKELRDFIVSSSVYPLAILSITLLVTVLLFTVFVPKFAKIFLDMGRELPASMALLIGVSGVAAYAWWLVPLILVLVWTMLRRLLGPETLQFEVAKRLLKLPLAGRLIADLQMCKYLRTMAILIGNHVEIIRTVRISNRVLTNPVVSRSFSEVDRKLKGGDRLSAALQGNPYLPHGMIPMLRVGEESGNVGEMLQRISANLESDTRLRIKRLLSLFEPAVIVFLALLVLGVVVAIFMAMMEMNTIGQGGPSL